MKITAKGKIYGLEMEVVAESKQGGKVQFLFNGRKDAVSEKHLKAFLAETHNIGNYIPSMYEDLNILNVLENYYPFDASPEITTEGVGTLPYEEGVIY